MAKTTKVIAAKTTARHIPMSTFRYVKRLNKIVNFLDTAFVSFTKDVAIEKNLKSTVAPTVNTFRTNLLGLIKSARATAPVVVKSKTAAKAKVAGKIVKRGRPAKVSTVSA